MPRVNTGSESRGADQGGRSRTDHLASRPDRFGLVGRCFHIFDKDGFVQHQGIVRDKLDDGYYLIQYFEWIMGEASTLAIVHISNMVQPNNHRIEGAWQFYEDVEHMNFWYEHRARRRE